MERARLGPDDRQRTDRELAMVPTAKADETHTCSRRRSIPVVGQLLARVRLDEIHDRQRVPRVQACISNGRRVKGAKDSAGTHDGPLGTMIGQADLPWAVSAAAVVW